jgi:hypothetical protein
MRGSWTITDPEEANESAAGELEQIIVTHERWLQEREKRGSQKKRCF